MSSNSLVSCIIIFFNAEQFFEEAIESVFAQTYDNWELLLADDGSTDRSTAIALHYTQKYPQKVRYLEHEGHQNRGMSATRNLGIRHAKGDYIAFLDSDDIWLPAKLEQQVAIMEAHPEAGMVYGRPLYWRSWTGNPEDSQRDVLGELSVQPDNLYQPPLLFIQNHPLGKTGAPCPCDFLLRKEIVEKIGGFEENFRGIYQLYEDQGFLAKLYLNAAVFVSSQCWDKYRLHPGSCSSRVAKAKKQRNVRLFFLKWLEQYLSEQGVKDTQVWQAVHKALWPYRHPILSRLLNLSQRIKKINLPISVQS
jgi:glycosyltransferase involved in cell wall biosynthesis